MRLIEIINARKVLLSISKEKVNTKLAYGILKFLKATDTEWKLFQDTMTNIINDYGEKDNNNQLIFDSNGSIKVKEEFSNECKDKIEELEGIDVDSPNIVFNINDFDELRLSVSDLSNIFAFIKE